MKNIYQCVVAVVLVVFGVLLIIVAFCVPPKGVIDATVLTAYGETLTFAGSLIGLDYHYRAKGRTPQPPEGGVQTPLPPRGGEYFVD